MGPELLMKVGRVTGQWGYHHPSPPDRTRRKYSIRLHGCGLMKLRMERGVRRGERVLRRDGGYRNMELGRRGGARTEFMEDREKIITQMRAEVTQLSKAILIRYQG